MSEPTHMLPIFPLPVVLFPGMKLPLHIFEMRYQEMINDILEGDRTFGVTLYMESSLENVGITTAVGTRAYIEEVDTHGDGRMNIMARGQERFHMESFDSESKPYLLGAAEPYEDDPADLPDEDLVEEMSTKLETLVQLTHKIRGKDLDEDFKPPADPFMLSFQIAHQLHHDVTGQQLLLEMQSCRERLEKEREYLGKVLPRLVAMSQIESAFADDDEDNGDEPADKD